MTTLLHVALYRTVSVGLLRELIRAFK